MKHKNYRLGIDVGTNSLGWAVLQLGGSGEPCAITAAGSRIFAEGREPKSLATKAATRRQERMVRRRRDRFKQRQRFLLDELEKAGLFPGTEKERRELQKQNPLSLRATALRGPLSPWQVGRAFFHINQRRGFKSNRRDQSEIATNGRVSRSARRLLEEMGLIGSEISDEQQKQLSKADQKSARRREAEARKSALDDLRARADLTYGSFLYERQRKGKPTRARPGVGENGRLYDVYPTRELYEDEFEKIWSAQAPHHRDLMTDEAKKRIHRAIFHQRPLKPQKRGKCTYMHDEDRAFRAMPSFQQYRIYQEVHNLEWSDGLGIHRVRDSRRGA